MAANMLKKNQAKIITWVPVLILVLLVYVNRKELFGKMNTKPVQDHGEETEDEGNA